jgi:hypothetical protein
VKSGNGSLILDQVNSHTGGVVVQAGQLIVRNTRALGTGGLWVMPGASVVFDVGSETVIVNSLTLEAGGTVDLGYGQITIGALGYVYADVQESLAAGHGNGFGGGSAGICSRYASLPLGWTVGYTLNWDGSMTVGYAAIGDTNLSGEVDIIDATNLLSSVKFGTVEAATWSEGDFNYDGLFDVLDLADFITANLFNSGPSRLAAGNSAGSVQQSTTAESTELTATDAAFITFAVESSSTSTTTVKKSRVVNS